MILLPLHLTAFLLLYVGAMRIVRGEILRAHTYDAHVILEEALQILHPMMVSHHDARVQERLEAFLDAHRLLDLQLFGPSGVSYEGRAQAGPAEAEVVAFLAGGKAEEFSFHSHGDRLALHGLVRLNSEASCQECHPGSAVLGAASMRLDMTEQVAAAQSRVGRHLGLLIVAWAALVVVTNVVAARFAKQSVARLRAGVGTAGEPPAARVADGQAAARSGVGAALRVAARRARAAAAARRGGQLAAPPHRAPGLARPARGRARPRDQEPARRHPRRARAAPRRGDRRRPSKPLSRDARRARPGQRHDPGAAQLRPALAAAPRADRHRRADRRDRDA